MTAGMRSAHTTCASLVENQTLPVSGCRLNENDISASIFADLYPMSAFLTIRGDNDTPCVCSSPFQRFSNEVLRSPRTICVGRGRCDFNHLSLGAMPWRRLFCESRDRHIVMDLPHFGQLVRYEGFFALPLTAINWASNIPNAQYPRVVRSPSLGSVDDTVSWMHWSFCFEDKQTLVLGNLPGHGSCSICSQL